jgi:membrane-associated phospholipid phosphatase
MPESLLQLDRHIFYFINHDLGNSFFDWLMPLMRNPDFWIPLYVFVFVFCLWRYKKTGVIIIAALALTFGAADYGSATLFKSFIKRTRPCNDPAMAQTIVRRVDCGPGYSFPSTHASNHFALAFCFSLILYKRWRWIWFWSILWAAVVCFAQVYVGVHYPVDVIGGAIYGIITGSFFAFLFKKLQPGF